MKKKGIEGEDKLLLIISGKSGSGKSALQDYIEKRTDFKRVVTVTTRPKRVNEIDGKDYFFFDSRDFINAAANQDFIETEVYNGWNYGTLKNSIHKDELQVIILTPSSLERFIPYAKERKIEFMSVYLDVDDESRIAKSYAEREDIDEVNKRFERDAINHKNINKDNYNLIIDNHNFRYSLAHLLELIDMYLVVHHHFSFISVSRVQSE